MSEALSFEHAERASAGDDISTATVNLSHALAQRYTTFGLQLIQHRSKNASRSHPYRNLGIVILPAQTDMISIESVLKSLVKEQVASFTGTTWIWPKLDDLVDCLEVIIFPKVGEYKS